METLWALVRPLVYLKVKPKGRARRALWFLNAESLAPAEAGAAPAVSLLLPPVPFPTVVAPADVTVPDGPGGPATQVQAPRRSRTWACAHTCHQWWGRLWGSWASGERKLGARALEGWRRTGGTRRERAPPGEAGPGPLTVTRRPWAAPSQSLETAPSQPARPPEPDGRVTLAEPGRGARGGAPRSCGAPQIPHWGGAGDRTRDEDAHRSRLLFRFVSFCSEADVFLIFKKSFPEIKCRSWESDRVDRHDSAALRTSTMQLSRTFLPLPGRPPPSRPDPGKRPRLSCLVRSV